MKTLFEKMRKNRQKIVDVHVRKQAADRVNFLRQFTEYSAGAPEQTYVRIVGPAISPWKRLQLLMKRLDKNPLQS